jgi:hypothetical protein
MAKRGPSVVWQSRRLRDGSARGSHLTLDTERIRQERAAPLVAIGELDANRARQDVQACRRRLVEAEDPPRGNSPFQIEIASDSSVAVRNITDGEATRIRRRITMLTFYEKKRCAMPANPQGKSVAEVPAGQFCLNCPHGFRDPLKKYENNGYCRLLNVGDWMPGHVLGLL